MSKRIIASLAILGMALSGCVALEGAGSYSIGYRSTSEVFVGHTTDGDKNDSRARSLMDLSQVLELLRGDEAGDSADAPSTGE